MYTIRPAHKEEAPQIAEIFMLAWPVDEITESNGITYEQLLESMTAIAARTETIYSFENTFVAEADGKIVGAMCAYDGADYQRLKQPIVDILGNDSGFAKLKETEALYTRLGFVHLDDKDFFGHAMKHIARLVRIVKQVAGTLLLQSGTRCDRCLGFVIRFPRNGIISVVVR